jgi:cysteine desulfurase/selenocysteine lyase
MREDFPQLQTGIRYFDNAVTSLKPLSVIEATDNFYRTQNANSRRGLYKLSAEVDQKIEAARAKIANYLGTNPDEIIFTHGATEGLNILANGLCDQLGENDEIIVTRLEHHSNLLPWRQHCKHVKILECGRNGNLADISDMITPRTKILAISAESNVLGEISNFEDTIRKAKAAGLTVVVDAAQAIAHRKLSLENIDFLAFSGHKMYGPMGVGVLRGKRELLQKLPPLFYGGEMVDEVHDGSLELAAPPFRFEAGTQNLAGIIGLEKAFDYLTPENFKKEQKLATLLREELAKIPEVELYGQSGTIVSFNIIDVHPHDVATILDCENFAIRAGYHCAQPLLEKLKIGPCCRASLSFYNNESEIEDFIKLTKTIRTRMGL